MLVRKAIEVSGIVQGVGFRPYIYRLAGDRGLAGSVCNTAAGVSIEVPGLSPWWTTSLHGCRSKRRRWLVSLTSRSAKSPVTATVSSKSSALFAASR